MELRLSLENARLLAAKLLVRGVSRVLNAAEIAVEQEEEVVAAIFGRRRERIGQGEFNS